MADIHLKKISWDSPKIFNRRLSSSQGPSIQDTGRSLPSAFPQNFLKNNFPEEFQKTDFKISDSLRENFLGLSTQHKKSVLQKLGEHNLSQLFSLSLENQPYLFFQRAYSFSQQLQKTRKTAVFGHKLLQQLKTALENSVPGLEKTTQQALLKQVNQDLNILEGNAPFLPQLVHHLNFLKEDLSDPILYTGFFSATVALHTARTFALSTLIKRFTPNLFTRGLGAVGISSLVGISAETTALTTTTRGLRNLLEPPSHASLSFGNELLANGVTLGFFHSAGALARKAHSAAHTTVAKQVLQSRLTKVSEKVFPQTAMLGAIYLGNYTNSSLLHLKPEQTSAALSAESLSSFFHLNFAGKVFELIQPRGFKNYTLSLQEQARKLSVSPWSNGEFKFGNPWGEFLGSKPAYVTSPSPIKNGHKEKSGILENKPSDFKIPDLILMEDDDHTPVPFKTFEAIRATPKTYNLDKLSLWKEALQLAPLPILVVDKTGNVIEANNKANILFAKTLDGGILNGNSLGDILEVVVPHSSLFRIRGGDESSSIFHAHIRDFNEKVDLKIYYLQDVTETLAREKENATLKKQLLQLAFLQSQLDLIESTLHNMGNTLTPAYVNLKSNIASLKDVARASSNPSEMIELIEQLCISVVKSAELLPLVKKRMRTRLSGEYKRFSLYEMLHSIIQLDQNRYERFMIEIRNEINPMGLVFEGDELQLFHAIYNITKNAFEAMPRGGVLTVKAGVQGKNIIIEIKDTGQGISQENLPKIFDIHFTTKKEGTGRGLFMTRETILKHNGDIKVESTIDKGTRFIIKLPRPTPTKSPIPFR